MKTDLWVIDLKKNTVEHQFDMRELETAQFLIGNSARISWPENDHLLWIGVEQDPSGLLSGEVVWVLGKRASEWAGLKWTLRRMSVRLFNPWSDRPGWIPLWALTKDETYVP